MLCRVFYKGRGIGAASKHPTSNESCYDDTGSSSLPPLTDTYIAFDRTFLPPAPPAPPINTISGNFFSNAATSLEQVPCFSNYPQINLTSGASHQQHIPLMEWNKSFNPVLSKPSCDKVLKSVLDQLTKFEGQQPKRKRDEILTSLAQASSESYLTETALSSSMWYPFQN